MIYSQTSLKQPSIQWTVVKFPLFPVNLTSITHMYTITIGNSQLANFIAFHYIKRLNWQCDILATKTICEQCPDSESTNTSIQKKIVSPVYSQPADGYTQLNNSNTLH